MSLSYPSLEGIISGVTLGHGRVPLQVACLLSRVLYYYGFPGQANNPHRLARRLLLNFLGVVLVFFFSLFFTVILCFK